MWGFAIAVGIVCLGTGTFLGTRLVESRARRQAAKAPPPPERPLVSQLPALASQVIEASDTGVIVVDGDGAVVLINPAAREMDVVAVDQLAFQPLRDIVDRARAAGGGVAEAVDLPMSRLGREPIALAVSAVPFTDGETIGALALLLDDLTEQRRLEAVRRDFVANVSHELKTPVGALTLLAEAVGDAVGDPAAVARFSERIRHETRRLHHLVRDLTELSLIQGGEPLPGEHLVDIGGVVRDAVDRARVAADAAGIALEVTPEVGLMVRGDHQQLTTAVANLVDNAIAYSDRGDRVSVAAVAGSDHQARPTVDIAVADSGIGIAAVDQARVFERFYRVDPARSRATGGTGLGLAIVKNIVTNHLGRVSVSSVEGEGSTFTIHLPRDVRDQQ
ncbi:MAG: two-component sensor histidine kinase [Jatrophihabitans sp.]|nr:MAG: two-component sensor histidine kinase [Jatrophihabitans sp.]